MKFILYIWSHLILLLLALCTPMTNIILYPTQFSCFLYFWHCSSIIVNLYTILNVLSSFFNCPKLIFTLFIFLWYFKYYSYYTRKKYSHIRDLGLFFSSNIFIISNFYKFLLNIIFDINNPTNTLECVKMNLGTSKWKKYILIHLFLKTIGNYQKKGYF